MTPAERKRISAQLLSTDSIKQQADDSIAENNEARAKIMEADATNKAIFDSKNELIGPYEEELRYIDGNERQSVTEQMFSDSAEQKPGNFFFPNDTTVEMPSLPDNVWTKPTPFALNAAIGRAYNEGWVSENRGEWDVLDDLEADIVSIGALHEITRITGQKCEVIPGPPDEAVISDDDTMQDLATSVNSLVAEWKSLLTLQEGVIPQAPDEDPNATRQAANNIALGQIVTIRGEVTSWEAYPDFDPEPAGPTGEEDCSAFYGIDPATKADTKFRTTILVMLSDAISDRRLYLTDREDEVNDFLGDIDQDVSTGIINSKSGLYGERFPSINIRLNTVLGNNLSSLFGLDSLNGLNESGKQGADDLDEAYSSILKATALKANTNGTAYVHVEDAADFSPGDSGYIVGESQPEYPVTIAFIEGNRMVMTAAIPPKYRTDDGARLSKQL